MELGLNFFDTADMYGPHSNEELLGEALRGKREQVFLASKFGIVRDPANPQARGVDGSPAYIRRAIEGSLKRLGTDRLDLYYQHRMDPQVPIEDSVGALADLVKAGKIRHIGLSEASAETLERAHRVPDQRVAERVLAVDPRSGGHRGARRLPSPGHRLRPLQPAGPRFLTGTLKRPEDFAADDYRRFSPRFQGENFAKNLKLVDKVGELAAAKGVKPSQLALAWVLAQGDDLIPIPGTKQRRYLEENVAATELRLSAAELAELDAIFPAEAVAGSRYSEEGMRLVNL